MKVYYPEYYHRFRCVASACPDSCCKEWTVDVDGPSAALYRSLAGSLGDRLRQVLKDTDDGTVMEIENGRCPMWREDGLCRIQAELGHDALCETCRNFPRLRHDYGNFVELGLELSCPEAAKWILADSGSDFLVEERDGGETPDYDPEDMRILAESRNEVLAFLQNSEYTVPESLAVLLMYGYNAQSLLDGGEGERLNAGACLAEARRFADAADLSGFLDFFKGLEILSEDWSKRLASPAAALCWSEELRAASRYFVQRYWLQAVSDLDLVSRVKLTVASCLLIAALGGEPVQTAQQYSKEIENNWDNVDAILDGAYAAPALTDRNLLSLLLNPDGADPALEA